MQAQAERMIKEYWNLKRELSVLEFQIQRSKKIVLDDVISSMCFSHTEGERVQTSSLPDTTARVAMSYRDKAERMSDDWRVYLIEKHNSIHEDICFFEHSINCLSGKLPQIIYDMAIERLTWKELSVKYHVSETMIGKYRKKAIRELDAMYQFKESQVEQYILG